MRRSAVIIVALTALASTASADKNEAETLYRTGERAFEAGRYDMAADAFESALEVLPLPAIAFSAAQAHRLQYFRNKESARLKRAVELYRLYIDKQKEGGRIKDAVANLAELEPILSAAEARGKVSALVREERTQLVLSSSIKEARGSVDGGELTVLPHDVVVEPGRHQVVIKARGYATYKREVDVVAGQMRAVEGELVPLPVKLKVAASAGATVRVDGRRVGTAPLDEPLQVDAGTHFLSVTKRGHRPFAVGFVAGRGEAMKYSANLETTRQRKISYPIIGAGLLVLTSASVAALISWGANGTAHELEKKRNQSGLTPAELDEYLEARDNRDTAQNVTLALLFTGVAIGGTGALLYWLDNSTPERPPAGKPMRTATKKSKMSSPRVQVAPVVGEDGAGVALLGRF